MHTSTRAISNSDDIIDSRDVIARIDELDSERIDLSDALTAATDALAELETAGEPRDAAIADVETATDALATWNEDYGDELTALKALADEAEGYAADWRHGEALIRDSYFETYARDLAEDIGAIDHSAGWPANHIDWEAAATALQGDYTAVDFDGVTYWTR